MAEQIAQWVDWGLWTADMVREAVPVLLTQAQADEILKREEGTA